MKPTDFETTTSPREANTEIGMRHGGTGSAMPDVSTEAASWLARHRPAEVDQAALSRASRHGAALRVRYEARFPSSPNGERLPSYAVAVGCDVQASPVARQSALNDLRNFMAPAPQREIEGWLAELSVIVAKRQDAAFDEELRLEAYTSRLRQYPADVAHEAVLGTSWHYWPTWDELEKRCNALASPRRQMIAALSMPPKEDRPEITPEQRARSAAMLGQYIAELSAQLDANKAKPTKARHWSETASPDDPRWAELRRARAANPLMNPPRDDA